MSTRQCFNKKNLKINKKQNKHFKKKKKKIIFVDI